MFFEINIFHQALTPSGRQRYAILFKNAKVKISFLSGPAT